MTIDIDTLGPVDWLVVEFPGSEFKGEIGPALNDLVDKGLVRVLDLLLLKKDAEAHAAKNGGKVATYAEALTAINVGQ